MNQEMTHVDQAEGLRGGMKRSFRVIAVTSGKGGVGKTNVVSNLALTMAKDGRRVLIIDADLGLANVDVIMGLTPKYDLRHLLHDDGTIDECIVKGPDGVDVISGGSGAAELTVLETAQKWKLLESLEPLSEHYDTLLIDTGAGIGSNVQFFAGAAHEVLVVVGPEPTSLTDAYSTIKVLQARCGLSRVLVVVNRTTNQAAARDVFRQLHTVTSRFLKVVVEFAGWIPHDSHVEQAVMRQVPFVTLFPMAPASARVKALADALLRRQPDTGSSGFQMFWRSLLTAEERAQ
ncbi:MAG: flagellar biosynthesis protein FlhG [Myxococcota bacterium]|jgi:flagellar biosynthesis protein FlhG